METISIKYDQVRRAAILDKKSNKTYFDIIREHFSYVDEDSFFRRGNKGSVKKKYLITAHGRFGMGLVWEIIKFVVGNNLPVKVVLDEELRNNLVNPINEEIKEVKNKKYQLRDYQRESIENFFKVGNGLQIIGTGGGKTLLAATILETLYQSNKNIKAIYVVPGIDLLNQTYNDFKEYKCSFKVSRYSGKYDLDVTSNVVICSASILVSRSNLNDWIDDRDVLIYDEVHTFNPTSKISSIFLYRDFKHRIGFTGSLPGNKYLRNYIFSHFGRITSKKSSNDLRKMGYLTNVMVQFIKFHHKNVHEIYDLSLMKTQPQENYLREIEFINNSTFRLKYIDKLCRATTKNILILVERLEQGENLLRYLSYDKSKTVTFVNGSVDVATRGEIIDNIENSDNNICIAMSTIFSTGISINNLHYLIFSNLGKKDTKTVQSIGRGLRLHDSKNNLIIFDLYDNLLYSDNHAKDRMGIYDEEKIKYKLKDVKA